MGPRYGAEGVDLGALLSGMLFAPIAVDLRQFSYIRGGKKIGFPHSSSLLHSLDKV
jgi:hypothetical protein